ncbi:hypothetical protein [Sphingomonas aracearum]|uniref:XRE family transcriptional regulator n=1 Tax=Sphingomonas aracearum TaxID=2283317 RepID=A0A369VRP6_9SPHN|nr:hypothetical protein [Sphingomonas aracearum]RDE04703.1 hypothetical protein DVW87_14035 [Sphingomonas aracearum]
MKVTVPPDPANARAALRGLAAEQGETLAGLSRLIGAGDRYLDSFVRDGRPRQLSRDRRRTLARYLGVSEAVLGALE